MNLFIIAPQNLAHTRPALATDEASSQGLSHGLVLALTVTRAIAMALGIALAYVIDIGMTTVLHVGIALVWDRGQ